MAAQSPNLISQLKEMLAKQFQVPPDNDELNSILGGIGGAGIGALTKGWRGALAGGAVGGVGGYLAENKDFFESNKEKEKKEVAQDGPSFMQKNPGLTAGVVGGAGLLYGSRKINKYKGSLEPQGNDARIRSLNRAGNMASLSGLAAPAIGAVVDFFSGNDK